MMSANNLASLGDKADGRRTRLRARVDAGESRSLCSVPTPVRPWFGACSNFSAQSVPSSVPVHSACVPRHFLSPLWWMSSGLLAAAPTMGVSGHVERLSAAPATANNAMLRGILATAGARVAPTVGVNGGPHDIEIDSINPRFADDHTDSVKKNLMCPSESARHEYEDEMVNGGGSIGSQSPVPLKRPLTEKQAEEDECHSPALSNKLDSAPASPMDGGRKCRLEDIVSEMRRTTGACSPLTVNGCKKRKLYQPIQHESRTASSSDSDREEVSSAIAEEDAETLERSNKHRINNDGDPSSIQTKHSIHPHLAMMQERYNRLYHLNGNDEDSVSMEKSGAQQCEMDLSVRCSNRQTPDRATPEKRSRDDRPVDVLHKINEENSANGTFIEYARRVLNADSLNKENERSCNRSSEPTGKPLRHSTADFDGLADTLKSEIVSSLSGIIDGVLSKWIQQRRTVGKLPDNMNPSTGHDLHSQHLSDQRRSPRTEILRRISQHNGRFPHLPSFGLPADNISAYNLSHIRPPGSGVNHLENDGVKYQQSGVAAALASGGYMPNYSLQALRESLHQNQGEQDDSPLSLVVTPKKKRHKITDSRAFARSAFGKFLSEESRGQQLVTSSGSPPPSSYACPPSSLLPPTIPSSVSLSNPSLPDHQMLHAYSQYYKRPLSPSLAAERMETTSPSLHSAMSHHTATQHAAGLLHSAALMAAAAGAAGQNSPDSIGYGREISDRSDANSTDGGIYDAFHSSIGLAGKFDARSGLSLMSEPSSTLTPMHLRKAKLMFFWSRYPSSSILKSYFPDIKFNKNNTAQLVKWFSNFREFFYIQMEKYARQALSEGVKCSEELSVRTDSELLRVLNLHYNRNNHSEIPSGFPYVAEAALREFFKAIQAGRDAEPSWKKAIYKVIARLDDAIPEYFRSTSFLEQLE